MFKKILITGATDGIGFEAARSLAVMGHNLLLHGRNPAKLQDVMDRLSSLPNPPDLESYVADFSRMNQVEAMANTILEKHTNLDVLVNNAGVFKTSETLTPEGLDVRFVVNTIAPYYLTKRLWPLLGRVSRIINLSSAAQEPVDREALAGRVSLSHTSAYSQSKLALNIWSSHLAQLEPQGPSILALNPGSLLASNIVREGNAVANRDVRIGSDILVRTCLDPDFAHGAGRYYDNNTGSFVKTHPSAHEPQKATELISTIERVLASLIAEQL